MPLIEQIIINDLITAWLLTTIFIILFIWLPMESFRSQTWGHNSSQFVGLFLRINLIIITGILSLSHLNLLNWLTLAVIYLSSLVFNYIESNNWQINTCRQRVQNRIFNLIDLLDQGFSLTDCLKFLRINYQKKQEKLNNYLAKAIARQGEFLTIVLTIVLGFAILLRWQHPLQELRFSHSDRYGILLTTRQILAGNYSQIDNLPIFSAWATGVSLLSSIDGMETIRFLSPLIGIILVLSVGYFVCISTQNYASALVAILCLGIYLFTGELNNAELPQWLTTIINSLNSSLVRQWTGDESELGAIFVLLGLGYYLDANRQHRQKITFKLNIIAAVALVIISAQPFLILIAIAALGSWGGKKLTLTAVTLTWIILAIFATLGGEKLTWTQTFLVTLPIALSLLAGLLFSAISSVAKLLASQWAETFCLTLILSLSINFLLPLPPNLVYVEYDMAARKSLELNRLFPPYTWTLVAPVEQLAEIYGFGGYQDLALFVETYAPQVSNPQFNFPISGKHLFILVEKIPFITFANEPAVLPNDILSDRTYRYYRSSAGRASLEYEALQMCETYRQHHPDSKIYYEDKELRIYSFNIYSHSK